MLLLQALQGSCSFMHFTQALLTNQLGSSMLFTLPPPFCHTSLWDLAQRICRPPALPSHFETALCPHCSLPPVCQASAASHANTRPVVHPLNTPCLQLLRASACSHPKLIVVSSLTYLGHQTFLSFFSIITFLLQSDLTHKYTLADSGSSHAAASQALQPEQHFSSHCRFLTDSAPNDLAGAAECAQLSDNLSLHLIHFHHTLSILTSSLRRHYLFQNSPLYVKGQQIKLLPLVTTISSIDTSIPISFLQNRHPTAFLTLTSSS